LHEEVQRNVAWPARSETFIDRQNGKITAMWGNYAGKKNRLAVWDLQGDHFQRLSWAILFGNGKKRYGTG
jgi:hypothetical protein